MKKSNKEKERTLWRKIMEIVKLNKQVEMPMFGLGTYLIQPEDAETIGTSIMFLRAEDKF